MREHARRALVALVVLVGIGVVGSPGPLWADDAHEVSGIVLGDGQKPISGATVRLRNVGTLTDITTTTGRDGRYAVTAPDDSYDVRFDAAGYTPAHYRDGYQGPSLRVLDGDAHNVSARLYRPGSITGTVVRGGKAASGVYMRLEPIAGGQFQGQSTSARGTFTFTGVVPGAYSLQADGHDDAYEDAFATPVVVTSGRDVVVPRMTMVAASGLGRLKGVISADRSTSTTTPAYPEWGAAAADTPIVISDDFITMPAQPVQVDRVRPGKYKIALDENTWIGGASFSTARTYTVRAGRTTTFSGAAHHGVGFEVLVQNARQEALDDMQVIFRRTADPTEIVGQTESPSGRGAGNVDIDGLPAAAYTMTIVDPRGEYASATVKDVAPTSVVTVARRKALPPATHRTGEAKVTIDSTYLGGADVAFYRADDDRKEVDTQHTFDPETGVPTWTIEPGEYRIRLGLHAWYGGGSFAKASIVDLEDGKLTRLPSAGLDPWGSYVGWVRDDAGVWVDHVWARVYAADDPTDVVATEPVHRGFTLTNLPVRAYKIRLTDPSGRYASRWVGGGTSFATAKTYTPDFFETSWLGITTVVRTFRAVSSSKVTGTFRVGHVLRSTTPKFSRSGATLTRRWYRDGRAIKSASGTRYRLTRSDAGHHIAVRVTGRRSGGTATTTSASTPTISR